MSEAEDDKRRGGFSHYSRPASGTQAARELSAREALPMGGGTDLLVSLEEGFVTADTVVDLRAIPDSDAITTQPDGSIRIGASARIQDIASHRSISERYRALADACAAVGTPALREMGTIGGNLCQRPRCWYLRRGVSCFKSGGDSCPAREGENQYHAILEGGPCYIVHPSDPAVALTALEAAVEITGIDGVRTLPIAEFYVTPRERLDRETILGQGEFVSGVVLPEFSAGGVQRYTKLMQRGAWDFALVSAAAVRRRDGAVRIVLGGVAPRPWRVPESLEEDVSAGKLDADAIEVIAERALYDAEPLSKNGYKVKLAEALIRRSIAELLS
ncbi:MAG TPA: FAD binding domain-containing protein [Gemmatimonadaceae bacterium]|nr:FAD binding domain-containing protein [Gemmatimonadaceae bacterium]